METVGDGCRLRAEEWFPNKKECNGENDPHGVFNALDTMLKSSLDRLKLMRLASCYSSFFFRQIMSHAIKNYNNLLVLLSLSFSGKEYRRCILVLWDAILVLVTQGI